MNYALLTVDVEAPKGEGYDSDSPVKNFIWCKNTNGTYGIDLIMDLCDYYNIKGLFFVDIAEAWDYGKEEISCVIKHIDERGHIVGMHIHPNHMLDENRFFLYEYSKEEQFKIIKECNELYKEILGIYPQYFRAGKYSANYDTLDILMKLGYRYDFSEFYGQKWCGIVPPLTKNLPYKYKDIIEIPVTVFNSLKCFGKKRYDKIDLNMSKYWHNFILRKIEKNDNQIISLFLHSFSFVNWRDDPNNPAFNSKEYKKIKKALDFVMSSYKIKFITPSQLDILLKKQEIPLSDGIEQEVEISLNIFQSYLYLLSTSIKIWKTNIKALIFVLINIVIFVFLLIICVILL